MLEPEDGWTHSVLLNSRQTDFVVRAVGLLADGDAPSSFTIRLEYRDSWDRRRSARRTCGPAVAEGCVLELRDAILW